MAEGNIDVVAIPMLSQGHIIPFMRLCELLSSRNLNVVFVTTPRNAERLRSEQADDSRVRLLEIPMPSVPGLPDGVESTERVPNRLENFFFQAMEEMQPSMREILVRLRPSSVIVDLWPIFLPDLATELNIYIVFFAVIGAYSQSLAYSLFISLPLLHNHGDLPKVVNLPGLPKAISMRDCDLLPPFREAVKGDPDSVKALFTAFRHYDQCNMVLVNTFYEMEAEMVDHLGSTFGKPVWSIGPLVPKNATSSSSGTAENPNSSFSDSECLKWLNSREPESVVYVNFGSQIALSAHQMQEVAAGLEASGQSFLWAVKKPNDPEDMDGASFISSLPVDLQAFIQRYSGAGYRADSRGLVVLGWVPQSQILGHPATGGHVSHCGWNSTLERIGQGVPILAWPFRHDHPCEAKLLVEELGVAEEIRREEKENGVFVVKREEVERAAKLIIKGEKGKEMRRRALQLKEGAERATRQGGSSFKNLDRLALLIRSKSN
uniref:Glycosyltransferase N-terminal domain-containing protein n=1 Tax=Picea sitchensis TaxID=3332 RepID=B8LLN3_PICSI|nr:unknown [Picea sitchensis]